MTETDIVLPDALIVDVLDNGEKVVENLASKWNELDRKRSKFRRTLIAKKKILAFKALPDKELLSPLSAVDGASLVEIERASAYILSCAAALDANSENRSFRSSIAAVPHLYQLNTIASGIMTMQEMILTVERSQQGYCLIDGSRISAIIDIHQFYSLMENNSDILDEWKKNSHIEPGKTIVFFENNSIQRRFYESPNIIGIPKLVTTSRLVEAFTPELKGSIDDKTFASIVLEEGEMLAPIPFTTATNFHLHSKDPQRAEAEPFALGLQQPGPLQLHHIYLKLNNVVLKLEANKAFFTSGRLQKLLSTLKSQLCAVDLLEPYIMFVADRFASEAVKVSKLGLKEMLKQKISEWAFDLSMSYRS